MENEEKSEYFEIKRWGWFQASTAK